MPTAVPYWTSATEERQLHFPEMTGGYGWRRPWKDLKYQDIWLEMYKKMSWLYESSRPGICGGIVRYTKNPACGGQILRVLTFVSLYPNLADSTSFYTITGILLRRATNWQRTGRPTDRSTLVYLSLGVNSFAHKAALLFARRAGVEERRRPWRGTCKHCHRSTQLKSSVIYLYKQRSCPTRPLSAVATVRASLCPHGLWWSFVNEMLLGHIM